MRSRRSVRRYSPRPAGAPHERAKGPRSGLPLLLSLRGGPANTAGTILGALVGGLVLLPSSFKDVDSLLQVGATSQRLIEWRSGAVTTRAQAVSLSGMPSLESTDTYLRSLLSAPATVGGTFTLTGGSEGFWLSAPGVRAGSVEIALTWLCTRDDVLTRYGVARQQPEVGPGRIGAALTELAGAFECLGVS